MKQEFSKIIIMLCFLTVTSFSFGQSGIKNKNRSITVLNPIYNSFEADLILQLNGDIVCNGGCSPEPLLGLLMKNNKNGWDTLVDINKLGQSLCGPGHFIWHNDTIGKQLFFEVPYIGVLKQFNNTSAVFKLTFLKYKKTGSKLECSNEFEIKITTPVKKNLQVLTGYLDTTVIPNFNSYPFFHYRVFSTKGFGDYFYVWHRIRYDGEGGNGELYLFDKVFYYTVTSLYEANNEFFFIQDYNHDGYLDFRIRVHPGQLDNLISPDYVAGYSAFSYYLFDNEKRTFVFSQAFSEAYHVTIDSAAHKITAHYYRDVPLEGGYQFEVNYDLPSMKLISSFRLERQSGGGWNKIPVGVHECFQPIPYEALSVEVQQPPQNISHYDMPEITTNRKHYFPPDTVFLLSNTAGALKDNSKLIFILEEKYQEDGKWHIIPNPYLEEKQCLKADYGFKIKAGDVLYLSNLEFGWLGLLTVGTYRIRVLLNEREVAKTEEFYVHD